MKFQDALKALNEGKAIKLPGDDYYLKLISKIYYNGDLNRPVEILSIEHHILRDDWEILD